MQSTAKSDLKHSTSEAQGVASSALLEFVEALDTEIDEMHSFILLRHGHVIAEGWWAPYAREYPHMLFSLSKSFTSTAVGLAVNEGYFSVDDPVISFFPDDSPAEPSDNLKVMTVHHLLSMATGHDVDTMSFVFEQKDGIWTKGFFEVPVAHEPGTHFLYNTGASYMLSAIVQKTTGMKLIDYLQTRLFEPLGIENPTWQESPQGINTGGFGLNITTEGIARFGQLYLQNGMWQGKQIIPADWVAEATRAQVANGDDPNNDWNQGYGYQFWRSRHNNYRGDGAFGQYCIVMPDYSAVIAITSGVADMQKTMNVVWDKLLPIMGDDALADDASAQEVLKQKLSNLRLATVDGQASSALVEQVSGRVYAVDENDANVETVSLNFSQADCILKVKTARGDETIPIGYGEWQAGQTRLFNDPWESESVPVVGSGAWTDESHYTAIIRLYLTPFYHRFDFQFDGDALTIEVRINVSFEPIQSRILKASSV